MAELSEHTTTHYAPTITREVEAMGVIETIMGDALDLSNAERWRIARWVADRWQQPLPPGDED